MKSFVLLVAMFAVFTVPQSTLAKDLVSGDYEVKQTWSQETNFARPYFVRVPQVSHSEKLPVFIFLHGNGGSGRRAMHGFMRSHPTISERFIMVFADGYKASWNIVSERSKADDLGYIEQIVKTLAEFDNVQANGFTIMGSSNGAALVNQLMIESKLPNVRNYISGVSPLNTFQHDGKNFKAKGIDNNYSHVAKPLHGKRLLNISGTHDPLVPYHGGLSRGIPAKGGKLGFVAAEQSIYLWAKQMGYDGQKLAKPTTSTDRLEFYSYLDGDVVHVKVVGEGHGATRAVSEKRLLEFLQASDAGTDR